MLAQAPVLQAGACVAWSLQTAVHTLDHSELVMSESDTDYVCEHIQCFLLHWQGMFQIFHAAEICRWKFRPKHHYFEEMMMQIRRTRINPRHLACWQDESYLGHIKKIALRCHAGTALLRVFQRLSINLSHRFHKTKETAKEAELLGCPQKPTTWYVKHLPLWNGVLGKKSCEVEALDVAKPGRGKWNQQGNQSIERTLGSWISLSFLVESLCYRWGCLTTSGAPNFFGVFAPNSVWWSCGSVSLYVYMYMCLCMWINIYIYIYECK